MFLDLPPFFLEKLRVWVDGVWVGIFFCAFPVVQRGDHAREVYLKLEF